MDFLYICEKEDKNGEWEVFPDFKVGRSEDLMIRGKSFYAVWDEKRQIWSTDEYDVQRLVDEQLEIYAEKKRAEGKKCNVKHLRSFSNNGWSKFQRFVSLLSDNSHQLDSTLTFSNDKVKKTDYVSRRLPYPLLAGDHSAWDELIGLLYNPDERAKIEWAIGAVISGDAKKLQKFEVFYGPGGTGKSTILNIIEKLFVGYTASFEAKALVGNNNAFSTEMFKSNPLVAIQHDGDLSKIEDNGKLNSIVSHEPMTMNEKYKPSYTAQVNAFLFMGTNKPVRISDAKSGLIRRLLDVHPTGNRFQPNHYHTLMAKIDFELGAIAHHCLEVYKEMGKNFYNTYRPLEMMLQTDVFFNFIEANYDLFKEQDGTSLRQAYALYKNYVEETGLEFALPQYKFREELRNYFDSFQDRYVVDGVDVRSYYKGFNAQSFKTVVGKDMSVFSLVMDETTSILDLEWADQPAQLAKEDGTPSERWSTVKTTLSMVDTAKEHYVKPPPQHIAIDFDLRGEDGEKSLERNLEAASQWPATYAEVSRSGNGVHLHYIWTGGELSDLDARYSDGIEVKSFGGNSSLRRRRSRCNNVPIAELNTGLPFKEKKPVLAADVIKSERGLRDLINRNLRKEIHAGTKPSIDFIKKILDDAYDSGMSYNVEDMRSALVAFANNSTNQPLICLKIVMSMRFKSEETIVKPTKAKDDRLVFFDCEVFPNLFVICWKYRGADRDTIVKMINPTPEEVGALFEMKLVGFNNRRYDNHILWARYLGYNNEQLYKLSKKIIDGVTTVFFGEAYNASYADVLDFSSIKQGLKKFQIALGIHHVENPLPWDEPVAEKDIAQVVEYCCNDVESLEAVFDDRYADLVARQILAELSGLAVNDTTQQQTAKIIFGDDRNPQREFVYTDLSKEFPGYVFDNGKSTYRGEEVGEGGYVYAEPGMYENVALLDVASMHPTSLIRLNAFGKYTGKFAELLEARLAIKNKEFERAGKLLDGRLGKYLGDVSSAKGLSDALKIVINIVYGLTSAKFENKFRDPRNKDNIVAKRGALFMIDLKHFVQEQGFTVAHIKTDSIKIPDATPEIIDAVKMFGEKYGYTFDYDPDKDNYDALCLVNNAVYIARSIIPATLDGDNEDAWKTKWTAVGAQFQHPYVFKRLFTGEQIVWNDYCEAKTVQQGAMYLDFKSTDTKLGFNVDEMHFVGRSGLFIPVRPESRVKGGILYRVKDDKPYRVTGTSNRLWVEAEMAESLTEDDIDIEYFEKLAKEAREEIDFYGEWTRFIGKDPWPVDAPYGAHNFEDYVSDEPPWNA